MKGSGVVYRNKKKDKSASEAIIKFCTRTLTLALQSSNYSIINSLKTPEILRNLLFQKYNTKNSRTYLHI